MVLKIPKYGQHVTFLGSTGSGKSFLAEQMLNSIRSYFVFDTQNSLDLQGAETANTPSQAVKMLKKGVKKIQYIPSIQYQDRDINGYILSKLCDSSSKKNKKSRVIYIDEIFHLGYMRSFPPELPIALATCRQKGISIWISTQRPRLIPTNVISESSYIYMFFCTKKDDIKYIGENVRENEGFLKTALNLKKDEHKFIFIDCTTGEYSLFEKLKV